MRLNKHLGFMFAIIIILIVTVQLWRGGNMSEGFSGGEYPDSVDLPILNSFKYSGRKNVSGNSASDIWWYYPSFGVGSFKQLTNNLMHRYNPDNGTCSRAEFCGALYKNNHNVPSNIVKPLPEAATGAGARVGYYRTLPNLLYFSIPSNENILY